MSWEMQIIFDFMYVTQNGFLLHNTAQEYILLHAADLQINTNVKMTE